MFFFGVGFALFLLFGCFLWFGFVLFGFFGGSVCGGGGGLGFLFCFVF